jgi:type II secretory pathway component PulF
MAISTVAIVVGVALWILGNIVLPLLVNAIERQFQREIDRAVSAVVSIIFSCLLWVAQIVLVLLLLPNITIIWVLEQVPGGAQRVTVLRRWKPFDDVYVAVKVITRSDFRRQLARLLARHEPERSLERAKPREGDD